MEDVNGCCSWHAIHEKSAQHPALSIVHTMTQKADVAPIAT
jgi:hypothetical protein